MKILVIWLIENTSITGKPCSVSNDSHREQLYTVFIDKNNINHHSLCLVFILHQNHALIHLGFGLTNSIQ